MNRILNNLYSNIKQPSSFTSINNLYKAAKQIDPSITLTDVKNYLKSQKSYTLHRITNKRFPRRIVLSPKPKVIISIDLADMRNLSRYNQNYKYILVVIDSFSRFAAAVPAKSKTSLDVLNALDSVLTRNEFKGVSRVNSDEGKEFYNKRVQDYLKRVNIQLYSVSSREIKAAIAERFIRTLKSRLAKYMTHYNTLTYIDVLPDIISNYNHTYHRTLKNTPYRVHNMTPEEVKQQFKLMYIKSSKGEKRHISTLDVGETVRIADENRNKAFRRGYTVQNTWEIFRIRSVDKSQTPVIYYLEDLNKEPILGLFYKDEIVKCSIPKTFDIDVIRSKKVSGRTKYLVRWRGYPRKFNSWIDESDITVA